MSTWWTSKYETSFPISFRSKMFPESIQGVAGVHVENLTPNGTRQNEQHLYVSLKYVILDTKSSTPAYVFIRSFIIKHEKVGYSHKNN
jgi:hypothetical protein